MPKFLQNKLLFVIFLAAFLRLFLLTRVPPSLNWDEVSMGYTAYSIAETGRDEWGEFLPLFFRSYGEWKSAVYIYLLVPLVKFFGLNAWTIRLPSALAGILAVYLVYLIGRRLYSEKLGLLSALFMAVTPWHLVLSRPAFEANVSLTLVLFGIYFFLLTLPRFKLSSLIYSAVFFGLAPHTYNSAKVIVPFLVLYLVISSRLYQRLKPTLIYFAVLAVFALPLVLNLSTGRSQYRYSQVGVTTNQTALAEFTSARDTSPLPSIINKFLFNKYSYGAYATVNNWLSYFDPAFLTLNGGGHNQHRLKYRGVLYFTELIFVILGAVWLVQKKKSPLPFILIGLGLAPAALTRDTHHVLRSILTVPGWVLLAGLGLSYLRSSRFKSALYLLLSIEVVSFLLMYFAWYPKTFTSDWQYGYREVAQFLREHQDEYDRIVMTKWYGEPQLFLAFYNRWDPAWFQAENAKNIAYETEGKIWLDQLPDYNLGKYTFKYLNWQEENKEGKVLFIGKGDDFYPDSHIVKAVNYPDGHPAFLLVEP